MTEQKEISDNQLISEFYKTHSNELLGSLLQRYTLLLLGVCMKYLKNEQEAKDAVQQIFLKIIPELHKSRIDNFKGWLYTVARNHCLMKLRSSKKEFQIIKSVSEIPSEDFQTEEKIEKDKLLYLLETSLHELNAEQKTCVTLFYMNKKSYNEISAETGFTLSQVKSYIQNGKRNLKQIVEKKMKN